MPAHSAALAPLAPVAMTAEVPCPPVPARPVRPAEHRPGLLAGVVLAHGLALLASQLGTPPIAAERPPIQVALVSPPAPQPVAPAPEPPKPKAPPLRKAVAPRPTPAPPVAVAPTPTVSNSDTALTAPVAASTPAPAPSNPAGKADDTPAPALFVPVNVNAAYQANPAPRYPPLSRRLGEQGKVDLRVRVSAEGRPDQVEIKTSSGYERLDQVALEAVRHWRFVPARQGDQSIASTVVVPIIFKLEES